MLFVSYVSFQVDVALSEVSLSRSRGAHKPSHGLGGKTYGGELPGEPRELIAK